jgi:replicative DNA helicase
MNAQLREVVQLRQPPCAIDAEQSVLGGLLLSPGALAKISDWLSVDDFYRRDHQAIYGAILALAEQSKPFDAVTVGEWFEAQARGEEVANGAYLTELASTTPGASNIVAYAEIVRDRSVLRNGITLGTSLVNDCFQPGGRDTGEILATHLHDLSALRGDPRAGGLLSSAETLGDWFADLTARYENGGGITGLPYPWAEVNAATHGLQPGELTIIAARPSMGKSVMGLNLALMNAMRGINVAVFSLEMTARQVNRRNVASLAVIPHDWLLAPNREQEEYWPRVSEAVRKLRNASLLVDESVGLTQEQVIARARRSHMQKPIGLLVIDHLHEIGFAGKREMRHEIESFVAAAKKLGQEFNCPVVLLAQLNRNLESRTDKRPMMADLRESGAIEQKADVIWFLYREDYYQRTNPGWQKRGDVELILGKGRDLNVSAPIRLRADFAHCRMTDWDGDPFDDLPAAPAGLR